MYPKVSMAHATLSSDYEQVKDYDKSLREYQASLILDGHRDLAEAMGRSYAAGGWNGLLRNEIEVYQAGSDYDPGQSPRPMRLSGTRTKHSFGSTRRTMNIVCSLSKPPAITTVCTRILVMPIY